MEELWAWKRQRQKPAYLALSGFWAAAVCVSRSAEIQQSPPDGRSRAGAAEPGPPVQWLFCDRSPDQAPVCYPRRWARPSWLWGWLRCGPWHSSCTRTWLGLGALSLLVARPSQEDAQGRMSTCAVTKAHREQCRQDDLGFIFLSEYIIGGIVEKKLEESTPKC